MSSGRGSHSRESSPYKGAVTTATSTSRSASRSGHSAFNSPAGSRRTTRHNGSLANNVWADELPGTRGGHARQQSIESARASTGQLSEAEPRAALSVDYAVGWENAVQLVSDAQPPLEELLELDRGARALDPDAAAALLLTHAPIPGAHWIWGTSCGTWASTYSRHVQQHWHIV